MHHNFLPKNIQVKDYISRLFNNERRFIASKTDYTSTVGIPSYSRKHAGLPYYAVISIKFCYTTLKNFIHSNQ